MIAPALIRPLIPAALLLAAFGAQAAVDKYTIDSSHTYPSFQAPHIGGISFWRGKIDKTSGTVTLDRDAKTGTVDIAMDMSSIDFGLDKMNTHAKSEEFFDVEKYPTASFKASRITFAGDTPSEVPGELTLHGITKPLTLKINSFKCITHPILKKEVCGADASAEFDRADYGVSYGIPMTGSGKVTLAIQVEALKDDKPSAR
jgi:polyisoprenoid-binding protein YceI